jgi:hypothetical protein
MLDRATRHRGSLDATGTHWLGDPPPHADQAGRREHDKGDKQQAEKKQPVRRPDRQVFAKENVEQRPERRAQQASHAADDHHRQQLAGRRDRRLIGRGEAMVKCKQDTGKTGQRRRCRIGDLLVALRRITDELRALLVSRIASRTLPIGEMKRASARQ